MKTLWHAEKCIEFSVFCGEGQLQLHGVARCEVLSSRIINILLVLSCLFVELEQTEENESKSAANSANCPQVDNSSLGTFERRKW